MPKARPRLAQTEDPATLGGRWRKALLTVKEERGLSRNRLADLLGVHRGMVTRWLDLEHPRQPDAQTIDRVARSEARISPDYVVSGRGGMFVGDAGVALDLAGELERHLATRALARLHREGFPELTMDDLAIDSRVALERIGADVEAALARNVRTARENLHLEKDFVSLFVALSALADVVASVMPAEADAKRMAQVTEFLLTGLRRLHVAAVAGVQDGDLAHLHARRKLTRVQHSTRLARAVTLLADKASKQVASLDATRASRNTGAFSREATRLWGRTRKARGEGGAVASSLRAAVDSGTPILGDAPRPRRSR